MKTCKDCSATLPADAFRPKASNKDGLESRCKTCRNIRFNKADPHRIFRKIYQSQIENSVDSRYPPPSYTFDQLIAWADQQPQLWQLWHDYQESGYLADLRPSVCRLDNTRSYDLGNIEIVTWAQNRARADRDRMAGILSDGPGGQRPVAAYNQDGSLHRRYPSIMAAVRDVNGRMWGVASVANGQPVKSSGRTAYTPQTYKGFRWKWI